MAYLDIEYLQSMGFKKLGQDVRVSDKASIYGHENIELLDNARIDDFSVLSAGRGGISIGKNVHVAVHCVLIGQAPIVLKDYSGLSSRVTVYSSSDDYSGEYLTNPTVPNAYRNVISEPVILEEHVIVGAGAVILPGVLIGRGSAIGAMSLVKSSCGAFGIYFGIPAKRIGARKETMLELEEKMNAEWQQ